MHSSISAAKMNDVPILDLFQKMREKRKPIRKQVQKLSIFNDRFDVSIHVLPHHHMVPKCLGEKLIYLHHFEFTIQASEILHKRFVTRILYSLMPILLYVPMHLFPLPVYPGLQVQRYEPIVLLHCASE